MSPDVESIIAELLARHRRLGRVDLNDIAEVVNTRTVTYDEIDHIIERLEAEGLRVGEPLTGSDLLVMRGVLTAAHRLRSQLQRRPTVDEISAESGHAPHTVRRVLEHGRRAGGHR
jgi:hypothetical protein